MTKSYYHATPYKNLNSILDKGILRGIDKVVYLTEDPEDSVKFLAVRGVRDILVIEVLLDEGEVEESYDHSIAFFGCRAYMYRDDISLSDINLGTLQRYELGKR